jgi:hypothetical protein
MLQHSKLKYSQQKDKSRRHNYTNCRYCGSENLRPNGTYWDGTPKFYSTCSVCAAAYHSKKHSYRKHKKDHCELCGFIPEHRGQLQVDHIDGSKDNNYISNLQTLCHNCHLLKTYTEKEHIRYKDNA